MGTPTILTAGSQPKAGEGEHLVQACSWPTCAMDIANDLRDALTPTSLPTVPCLDCNSQVIDLLLHLPNIKLDKLHMWFHMTEAHEQTATEHMQPNATRKQANRNSLQPSGFALVPGYQV